MLGLKLRVAAVGATGGVHLKCRQVALSIEATVYAAVFHHFPFIRRTRSVTQDMRHRACPPKRRRIKEESTFFSVSD